jgi:hypothetical protein
MKIEVGKVYKNKVNNRRVIVNRIEGRRVYFAERGMPGQTNSTSIRDFALKYEEAQ